MLPKKRLVIGTRTSAEKGRESPVLKINFKNYKDISGLGNARYDFSSLYKKECTYPSISKFVLLNVLAS